jgi:hypothetical protein
VMHKKLKIFVFYKICVFWIKIENFVSFCLLRKRLKRDIFVFKEVKDETDN